MPSREKTSVFYKGYKKPLTPPPSFCPIFIQVRTTFSRLSGGFQRFSAVFGCLSGGFQAAHRTNQKWYELVYKKNRRFLTGWHPSLILNRQRNVKHLKCGMGAVAPKRGLLHFHRNGVSALSCVSGSATLPLVYSNVIQAESAVYEVNIHQNGFA